MVEPDPQRTRRKARPNTWLREPTPTPTHPPQQAETTPPANRRKTKVAGKGVPSAGAVVDYDVRKPAGSSGPQLTRCAEQALELTAVVHYADTEEQVREREGRAEQALDVFIKAASAKVRVA